MHFSYRRFLENRLREAFGFDGTPIRLVFRERSSVKLPKKPRNGRPYRSAPVRALARTRFTHDTTRSGCDVWMK